MKLDIKSQRQCIYCHNFCKFSCSPYLSEKDQKILQTQRNYLIYLHNNKKLKLDAELGRSVYLCNDCKRCEYYCIYDGKDVLPNNRYSKELIFKNGFAPDEVYKIEENLKKYKNAFGLDTKKKKINKSYHHDDNEYDIYIYSGDYVKHLEPQVFDSFVKILDMLDISYVYDEDEISDGILALDLGMADLSKNLMEENFCKINKYKFKKMVVLSPECCYGFKVEYEKFGYKFKNNVVHYTEFINDYINNIKVSKTNDRIKYFDPCKLGRFLGIFEEPRNILTKLFGAKDFEFFKNKEESNCCGGYISLYDRDFSNNISMDIIRECKESGCNVLITACPLCLNNLKRAGSDCRIKIYDLLEYIDMHLER